MADWLGLVKGPGSPRYALARTGASGELAAGHATLCFLPTGAEVREAWQQPLAQTGYAGEGAFPLVSLLTPKMRARIVLTGDPDSLDVFSSQLQVEAVFNRGLTLKKARPQPDRLEVCRLGP